MHTSSHLLAFEPLVLRSYQVAAAIVEFAVDLQISLQGMEGRGNQGWKIILNTAALGLELSRFVVTSQKVKPVHLTEMEILSLRVKGLRVSFLGDERMADLVLISDAKTKDFELSYLRHQCPPGEAFDGLASACPNH